MGALAASPMLRLMKAIGTVAKNGVVRAFSRCEATRSTPGTDVSSRGSYRQGFSYALLSMGSLAIVGIVATVVTARVYGIRVIGEFALATAPVGAMWFLTSVKEQAALIRRLTSLQPRDPLVTALFLAVLAFSGGLTVVVSALAAVAILVVFPGPLDQPDLVVPALASLATYALVINLSWNIDGIFSAFVAGRQLFWIRFHEAVGLLVLSVVLGLLWQDVWSMVIATTAISLTTLLHRVLWARPFMRLRIGRVVLRQGFSELPSLIRFGLKIVPGTIAQGLSNQTGTWAVGFTGAITGVGAYSRAQLLGSRFQDLNRRVIEILFPTLAARWAGGDRGGFDRALIDTLRYMTIGNLLLASVGGGAAVSVMALFGPGFDEAATALALLLLLPTFATASSIYAHALYAVDRPWAATLSSGVRLAVTLVSSIALTISFGVTGAALGLVTGIAVDAFLKGAMIRRHLDAPFFELWPRREVAALVVASSAAFATARVVDATLPGMLGLLAALTGGTLVYLVVFLATGGIRAIDRQRLSSVLSRVPHPRMLRLADVVRNH